MFTSSSEYSQDSDIEFSSDSETSIDQYISDEDNNEYDLTQKQEEEVINNHLKGMDFLIKSINEDNEVLRKQKYKLINKSFKGLCGLQFNKTYKNKNLEQPICKKINIEKDDVIGFYKYIYDNKVNEKMINECHHTRDKCKVFKFILDLDVKNDNQHVKCDINDIDFSIYDKIPTLIDEIIAEYFNYSEDYFDDNYIKYVNKYSDNCNEYDYFMFSYSKKYKDRNINNPTNIHLFFNFLFVDHNQYEFILTKLKDKLMKLNDNIIWDNVCDEHLKTNGFRQLWCLKDKFEVINGELVLNPDKEDYYCMFNKNIENIIRTNNNDYLHQLFLNSIWSNFTEPNIKIKKKHLKEFNNFFKTANKKQLSNQTITNLNKSNGLNNIDSCKNLINCIDECEFIDSQSKYDKYNWINDIECIDKLLSIIPFEIIQYGEWQKIMWSAFSFKNKCKDEVLINQLKMLIIKHSKRSVKYTNEGMGEIFNKYKENKSNGLKTLITSAEHYNKEDFIKIKSNQLNLMKSAIEKTIIEELPFEDANFDVSLFLDKLEIDIEDGLDYYNKYYYRAYVTNNLWKYYIDEDNIHYIVQVNDKLFELNNYHININGKEKKISNLLKSRYQAIQLYNECDKINASLKYRVNYCDKYGNVIKFDNYINTNSIVKEFTFNDILKTKQEDIKPNKELDDKVNKLLDFIKNVICLSYKKDNIMVRDEEMINNKYNYLMSFIHNIFNRKKNKVCIVLYSKKGGTGKSTLCKLMTNILGNTISSVDGTGSRIFSNFNTILSNNLFYCLEEFTQSDKSDWFNNMNKFKDFITNDKISIEQKGKDLNKSVNNYNSFIITTNSINTLYIEKDDRRFTIFNTLPSKPKDTIDKNINEANIKYWEEIYDIINQPEILKRFYVYVKYNTFGYEKDCLFTNTLQTPEKMELLINRTLSDYERFIGQLYYQSVFILSNDKKDKEDNEDKDNKYYCIDEYKYHIVSDSFNAKNKGYIVRRVSKHKGEGIECKLTLLYELFGIWKRKYDMKNRGYQIDIKTKEQLKKYLESTFTNDNVFMFRNILVFRINLEQLQIKLLNEKIINKDHNITEEDLFL